jgi:DNA-directed RNA polymerase subunit RPC12/RpoP
MDIRCVRCGSENIVGDRGASGDGLVHITSEECGEQFTRPISLVCPRCGSSDVTVHEYEGWAYDDPDANRDAPSAAAWSYIDRQEFRCLTCQNTWRRSGSRGRTGPRSSRHTSRGSCCFAAYFEGSWKMTATCLACGRRVEWINDLWTDDTGGVACPASSGDCRTSLTTHSWWHRRWDSPDSISEDRARLRALHLHRAARTTGVSVRVVHYRRDTRGDVIDGAVCVC